MEKAMIRLRMGSHDAHYGGELVDGAKMLQLASNHALGDQAGSADVECAEHSHCLLAAGSARADLMVSG